MIFTSCPVDNTLLCYLRTYNQLQLKEKENITYYSK